MKFCGLVLLLVFSSCISWGQVAGSPDSPGIIEKVYLHADREIYSQGDDIWFKAYLIDASSRLLTGHSNNLHIELIAPDSKIIDSRVVRLSGGLGNGDFKLSEKLVSGKYRLRAYTNYMRNFGDQLFYNKDITIVNPAKADAKPEPIENKLEISFFPEGGSLVDNVISNVSFKAVNALGEGCDVTGELYASNGEKLSSFKSTHKGMGTLSLKPVPEESYYVVIKDSYGHTLKSDIPKSFHDGVAMNVTSNQPGELEIILKTNKETLPSLTGRDLAVSVSAHGRILKSMSIQIKSLSNLLTMSTDDLPDGIVALTLSDGDGKPQCERLVYIQNNEDVKINIESDKQEYKQRDSVSLGVSISGIYALAPEAYISLSAVESAALNESFPSTISSWFLLESDVRGEVEDPSYYFDPSNPGRLKDLDLLLLTQGWRDFRWKYGELKFPPENGFTISGRVRKRFADVPVKNAIINIGIFSKGKPVIGTVPTDSTGRFFLKEIDLTDTVRLIASITGDEGKMQGWLLIDSMKYTPEKVTAEKAQKRYLSDKVEPANLIDDKTKNIQKFIQSAEYKTSVSKKYKLSDTIMPGEVTITARRADAPESPRARSIRYLGTTHPDHEYVVDPKMDVHYINALDLVKTKWISQSTPNPGGFINVKMRRPYYMIDGNIVPESNVSSIPINWVERIDVVEGDTYLLHRVLLEGGTDSVGGSIEKVYADGAISIILKDDLERNIYFQSYHSINTKVTGYNEPRIFYSPSHHTTLEKDYKPDLRTTLLWEPNLNLQNNNKAVIGYFNADDSSVITIIAEGITSTGIPVTGKAQYEVK